AVPDVRMDVQAAVTIAPEGDEALRGHVVPRQCERHDEALAVQGIEELTAVGVIVGAPDECTLTSLATAVGARFFRPVAPAEEVAVTDGVIARVQRLALPGKLEQALGHAALVAGIRVDGTPALSRPGPDFDLDPARLIDQTAVAFKGRRARRHERRVVHAPYAGRGYVRDGVGIDVHTRSSLTSGVTPHYAPRVSRAQQQHPPRRTPRACRGRG